MPALGAAIDRLRHLAMRELEAAAGDLSMCAIAKSGVPMPAVKYHEGRVAMLREIRAALVEDQIEAGLLQSIRSRWEDKRGLAVHSQDWEAYLNGGEDVLADLGLG